MGVLDTPLHQIWTLKSTNIINIILRARARQYLSAKHRSTKTGHQTNNIFIPGSIDMKANYDFTS